MQIVLALNSSEQQSSTGKYIYICLSALGVLIALATVTVILCCVYKKRKLVKASKSVMDAALEIDKQKTKKKYPRSERSKRFKGDLESGFPWGLELEDIPDSEPEGQHQEHADQSKQLDEISE